MPTVKPQRTTTLLYASWALLVCLAVVPRFWNLAAPPFDPDEVWEVTHNSASLIEQARRVEGFPPLHGLLLGWVLAISHHDLAARVLSAVCGVVTVPVAAFLGRAIGGSAVGWWTAVLLAVSPYHIMLSRSGRPYGLYVLVCSLAVLAALRVARGHRSVWDWLWFAGASWLSLATGYLTGVLVVLLLLLLAWTLGSKATRPLARTTAGLTLACLPLLYCLWIDVREMQSDYFHVVEFDVEGYAYTYFQLLTGGCVGPAEDELRSLSPVEGVASAAPWAAVVFAVAAALAFAALRLLPRKYAGWLAVLVIAPPLILALASPAIPSGYNHRYISWMCVPLAALLAAGATLSVKRPLRLL
ncbi:MAG: glycosyltransferase family 39 protein, partial [Planctomycetales bacterium]|nr:glycosyltransferase family 39 protein [Planctomycetales bacterium]